jgi:hypothetical protein
MIFRKREKQFYHQRPDISPVRGTNFSTENNDGAFFPAHSKITGPGHGESPLIKRKTPSPYNKHGENDDIGHLSRREQIPWEYRFRQPEFSPQNQRDFTGRGGRPFRGGRFRGGRARGRDFPPPAKVESLLVKKGLILGNFGTPAVRAF